MKIKFGILLGKDNNIGRVQYVLNYNYGCVGGRWVVGIGLHWGLQISRVSKEHHKQKERAL